MRQKIKYDILIAAAMTGLMLMLCAGQVFAGEGEEQPDHKHVYGQQMTEPATPDQDGCIYKECQICHGQYVVKMIRRPSGKIWAKSYNYTGREIRIPASAIVDTNGKKIGGSNYDIIYPGRLIDVGIYQVRVRFKGDRYKGEQEMEVKVLPPRIRYKIDPKAETNRQVSLMISGYRKEQTLEQYDGYELMYGKGIMINVDKPPRGTKIKKILITDKETQAITIRKLKPGTYYTFRIRAYKKLEGTKIKLYSVPYRSVCTWTD